MRRIVLALLVLAPLALIAAPANAGVTRDVVWRCTLEDGSTDDFVTAPGAAYGGLATANAASGHAAQVLGEECEVVHG
jgi:hypothetical protein